MRGRYDMSMRGCTAMLGGAAVIERRRIVDPKMTVERVVR